MNSSREIEIDDLADYMFLQNSVGKIALSLPDLNSNKDLFFFLLDLFCKGLLILYGNNFRVEVEKLTLEDFEKIKKKMQYAGIIVNLQLISHPNSSVTPANPININDISNLSDHLEIKDYVFKLSTLKHIYCINFSLDYV